MYVFYELLNIDLINTHELFLSSLSLSLVVLSSSAAPFIGWSQDQTS